MPLNAIKNWQYSKALLKLPGISDKKDKTGISLNPAKNFLLFFDGTRADDVRYFQQLHVAFEKRGSKLKILSFVQTKVDVHQFGMALYNESSVQWNFLPKPKLQELVQSRSFDILFNINPAGHKHMHFLAVAAKAAFKVSTPTDLPNDFSLFIKSKTDNQQPRIYEEMWKCLESLSI